MHATLSPAATRGLDASAGRPASARVTEGESPRQVVFHLPEVVVAALQQEAGRRGVVLSEVAEQAWRIARTRVQQAARIDELYVEAAAAAYRAVTRSPIVVSFSATSEQEIQREAARLDATVSQVFAASWHVAHDVMRLTSSLLS
jgi:hypothetical protein